MKTLPATFRLAHYNNIPILEIRHALMSAKISLQGAQLLSWKPIHANHDIFWLSEIEPFTLGNAIRGGVPICYPWFGGAKQPPHGTARNRLWELTDYSEQKECVQLTFYLSDENKNPEAKMEMALGESCELCFTHLGAEPAQAALHSYFHVQDIEKAELFGLPNNTFNALTQQQQAVDSPQKITKWVDEIYQATGSNYIEDSGYQRQIVINHQNATEVIIWNPWQQPMSAMSEQGYRTMVCVETGRIYSLLAPNESIGVIIQCQQLLNRR